MRRSTAAIVLLLALGACSDEGGAASAAPQWEAPGPEPTATVLPAGLVVLTTKDQSHELRVYDVKSGAVLRRMTLPEAPEGLVFRDDYATAAALDRSQGRLLLYRVSGTTYEATGELNADALGAHGLSLSGAGFVPGTTKLAVTVDGGDGGRHYTVTLDPADPGKLGTFGGEAGSWDSAGDPAVEPDVIDVPGAGHVTVRRTARELVDATVAGRPDEDGRAPLLYACRGPRQLAELTLACYGMGRKAEIVALTAAGRGGRIRPIADMPGKPITDLVVSPGGKEIIAQRADGYYLVPVGGGTPKRLFGRITGVDKVSMRTWR